ncbi:hypothetical protein SAMN04487948_11291 [Halogranum amylolyticum]|uniref:Uncharacterized protein n=1 Tax=Halogranum amylolyticum TaxID=660520 RepID=A0A1H8UTI3_9EURY|nr:hypothetical protein [Halogranum amylolyticum]SEP06214.1 hypothetical protein SAMN04487948_11291 [Halogranum amylolyticum]
MVEWECPTNPREASGLDPEAVHKEAMDTEIFDQLMQYAGYEG